MSEDPPTQSKAGIDDLRAAAAQRVETRRLAWEKARADLDRTMADPDAARSAKLDSYWLKEHRARTLYEAARLFLASLERADEMTSAVSRATGPRHPVGL